MYIRKSLLLLLSQIVMFVQTFQDALYLTLISYTTDNEIIGRPLGQY